MHAALHEEAKKFLNSARALGDRDGTFRDRAHAARSLLEVGMFFGESRCHLVSVAPGDILAREISRLSDMPLSFAVVAEFAPPWTGGPSFGAVAFDGSVVVDDHLKEICSVPRDAFHRLVQEAYERAVQAASDLSEDQEPLTNLRGHAAIVIDDGLSPPLVIRAAMTAVRNAGARCVVLALPIGHRRGLQELTEAADLTFCANTREANGESTVHAHAPLPCLAAARRRHTGNRVAR